MIKDEITKLLDAYPSFSPRNLKGTITTYSAALSDIPEWLLSQAVDEHIKSSKFFPAVAELRQLSERLSNTRDLEHAQPETEIPAWNANTYWAAMSVFNDSLAGEVKDGDLRRNVSWIAYERRVADKHD
jgi:hypothetical protein